MGDSLKKDDLSTGYVIENYGIVCTVNNAGKEPAERKGKDGKEDEQEGEGGDG